MQDNHYFSYHLPATGWVLAFVLSVITLSACGNKSTQAKNVPETSQSSEEEQGVTAPKIEADASGLIGLDQCPTTNDRLRVEVSEEMDSAIIYLDNELLQTITDPDGGLVAAGGEPPIFFLDANFDGFADIFIGPGESRTYSTLLVWEPSKKQFRRIGKLSEPSLQNFLLCPETKSVFEGGSDSWCSFSFSRSEWENGNLKVLENITLVNDPEQYGENHVSDKYTLIASDGKKTSSV